MFGPSKDEVWQPFAEEIGAEFIRGGVKDGWSKKTGQIYLSLLSANS